MSVSSSTSGGGAPDGRRGFLAAVAATVLGAIVTVVPAAAGLITYFDPVRRKGAAGGNWVKVGTLEGLPDDGIPRRFRVIMEKVDAWSKTPATPVGAVYLRRTKEGITALHSACPHAGCFVDYQADKNSFFCPCHNSLFAPDGKIASAKSPSPRDLDTLTVEVRNASEIWIRFVNYQAGHKEKREA